MNVNYPALENLLLFNKTIKAKQKRDRYQI